MNKIHIGTFASTIVGDKLWFSNSVFNGLLYCDIKRKIIKYVCSFEGQAINAKDLHRDAFFCDGLIIFSPLCDDKLRIYNTKTGETISLPIKQYAGDGVCSNATFSSKRILWACNEGNIYEYAIGNDGVEINKSLSYIYTDYRSKDDTNIQFCNNTMRIIDNSKGIIIDVDVISMEIKKFNIPRGYNPVHSAYDFNDQIWCSLVGNQQIVIIEKENGQVHSVNIDSDYVEGRKELPFTNIQFVNGKAWITNWYGSSIAIVDVLTGDIENLLSVNVDYKLKKGQGYGPLYTHVHSLDDKILVIPDRGDRMLICDCFGKVMDDFLFEIDLSDQYDIAEKINKAEIEGWGKIVQENDEWFSLGSFLNYVIKEK